MNELRLTVNGEKRAAAPGTTVSGLLTAMGVDPARVAVERNEDVVPRKTWTEAALADGDKIEIVAFVVVARWWLGAPPRRAPATTTS